MAQQTSDHIKPCKIGQSEAHNRRSEEYLTHINKDKIYLRPDLMEKNESWLSPEMSGMDLQAYYNLIARMVKEKTGRAMQTKERARVDKKTGKTIQVNGSSPIREGVVVCKADTTIDELQRYCRACHEKWGVTALQIHIHRDEGHYQNPNDQSTWTPNFHAHIVWDWMNHETGKSCKLGKEDMSLMQDMVAEALSMERGTSKSETGKRHLERTDYILAKQKQEAEEAAKAKATAQADREAVIRETDKAKAEQTKLHIEIEAKKLLDVALDSEIAYKEEQARKVDKKNAEGIKSGIANLLGMGKYEAIEKENRELKQSVPKEKERLQELFSQKLKEEISKRTKAFADQQAESKRQCEELRLKHNTLVDKYNNILKSKQEEYSKMENRLKWRDHMLYYLADALYKGSEFFKQVIDGIIDFARSSFSNSSGHRDVFYSEEVVGIKNIMNTYADTKDEKIAVGNWLVNFAHDKGKLTDIQVGCAKKEIDAVAEGRYDWKIEGRGKNNKLTL